MNNFVRTFLCLCFVLCLATAAFSATYTVTKIADTNDGACDADCSLREAVAAAAATADNDTIQFSTLFNQAQTITLSGTDIIITGNGTLTINGTGANLLTISGNNASRVFTNQIVGTTQAVTNISNLRVTSGNGVSTVLTGRGGGIYNNGSVLTLTNVVVTGNTAANGGGLNNATGAANMTLISCTVSNNTSTSSGGGMQNFSTSTLTILNTTVSGNTSNGTGIAGGAMQANGTIIIANSTFSGNNAPAGTGGGIYFNGTVLTMNNVTITNNTTGTGAGGLHKTTTNPANVRNTIIAGNTGAAATPDVFGAVTSRGNNLIGAVGTSTGWIASDLLNSPALLAPLAGNGGATQTHALLPNSPAINAGQNCVVTATCVEANPPAALTTDQRGSGFPRQVGAAVDIGAFEFNSASVPTRTAFDFDGDGRTDYGVFRPANGTWYLNRSTAGAYAVQFGISTDRLAPADYDGDGKTDVAVWRAGALGYFYIFNSSNNTVRTEQFGRTGDDPRVVGDWDGDGKADPAVYRAGAAAGEQSFFFYRPSAQPAVDFVPIRWGTAGDVPLRGDFDGDGKLDAAVYRASDNIWYIRQSSNNQPRYAQWGNASDERVQGDFDGDGKTDLVIFRAGLWAILQSSDNQPRYQQFGQAGDRPAAGDYDGDGKTDFAVWRAGVFYVLLSNGNQAQGIQFGTSSDVPVASAFNP